MNSISPDLNIMIKASEKASKALIRDFGEVEKLQVSSKGPFDFVSNADIKAEKIIIEELNKSKRNYSIICEESENKVNDDKKVRRAHSNSEMHYTLVCRKFQYLKILHLP